MTIADRVEQASGPETRELLIEAWRSLHPGYHTDLSPLVSGSETEGQRVNRRAFRRKLDAEAYLDAAMTLAGDHWTICSNGDAPGWQAMHFANGPDYYSGATPALALLAAFLRAHEQGGQGDE